jgi:hypothetical protein
MRSIVIFVLVLFSFSTWGQSMKDLNNKDKIKFFFDKLSKDNMQLVDEFYDSKIEFIDSVGSINGTEKIKAYYSNMYQNVKSIKFDYSQFYESENSVVAIWKMTLQTDKLNGGDPFTVDGNSIIKFGANGKAIYHRDYFDMGAFIYERLPVIGFVIKKIKDRFKVE